MAMLLLGILIGCIAGLFLIWCLWRHGGAVEPFFLRLLQHENRAEARIDTRLMLHELLRKVEDLTVKTHRMDMELQELQERSLYPAPVTGEQPQQKSNLFEICRFSREGLSADEIACRFQMGRGEVELLLSLQRKPDWVVSDRRQDQKIATEHTENKDKVARNTQKRAK